MSITPQSNNYSANYSRWLESPCLSEAEKAELLSIGSDEAEIEARFSSFLSFGTAGLRGKMKTGMNAMNVHTVSYATQAIALLINDCGRGADGVAIAYDSRNNSELFARACASVLAANGIKAYIFDGVRPTPELSFALRYLKCIAGINITASHNPKEYNGYKAYWEDGAQLPPEHAATVTKTLSAIDIFDDVRSMSFEKAIETGLVEIIGSDIDEAYLKCVLAETVNPSAIPAVSDELKIVFTPLHGAGYKLVPEALRRCGVKHLFTVSEQALPDGDFPTVAKPNPEFAEVFELGIKVAQDKGSDLIIACDPDCDRVGVMARKKDGSFTTITGNQMGALLLDYIITAYESTNTMPSEPYAVKSIVSTVLASEICRTHGVEMFNVLTGFKYIGEVIKNHETSGRGSFLFGFEESYGYLKGTYARDKDAVVASMLIAEMTAYYRTLGLTLYGALERLWERYGYYLEHTSQIEITGHHATKKMAALMQTLRAEFPRVLCGRTLITVGDYLDGYFTDVRTGERTPTGLPSSDVLYYVFEGGDTIVVRPSGTEPKVKFYYLVCGESISCGKDKIQEYRKQMAELIQL